jgi:hypothetical protein
MVLSLSCGPRLTGELTVVTNAGLANRQRPAGIFAGAGPGGARVPRAHRWHTSAAGWNCIPWLQSFATYPGR